MANNHDSHSDEHDDGDKRDTDTDALIKDIKDNLHDLL